MRAMHMESVEKIRRDHDHMLEMIERIKSECTQTTRTGSCNDCQPTVRHVCHASIDQLIRSFVEFTLRHNLVEAAYMADTVPAAHRIAHNRAHLDLACQLKAIRVIFSEDGNCVLAIEGIDQALQSLLAHFEEFDRPLEAYLLDAA
jgi:hemerythrin